MRLSALKPVSVELHWFKFYQHFLSEHWETYDLDTMKLPLGRGNAEANPCEREYTDQEDDGHMESVKGSQKLLKHVAVI